VICGFRICGYKIPSYMFVYVDCCDFLNRKTPMGHDVSEWDVDAGFGSISEWVLVLAA
jgi:hypothetical protein